MELVIALARARGEFETGLDSNPFAKSRKNGFPLNLGGHRLPCRQSNRPCTLPATSLLRILIICRAVRCRVSIEPRMGTRS